MRLKCHCRKLIRQNGLGNPLVFKNYCSVTGIHTLRISLGIITGSSAPCTVKIQNTLRNSKWLAKVSCPSLSIPKISSESLKFQKALLIAMIDPFKTILLSFLRFQPVSPILQKQLTQARFVSGVKYDAVVC